MSKRTFQPSKRKEEISTDLWTMVSANGRKVLRVEEQGRHKLTVSSEPRHKNNV
jgi:ribosomal protein L34